MNNKLKIICIFILLSIINCLVVCAEENYIFVDKFGVPGSDIVYNSIIYITIDSSGHVYVSDIWNDRVKKLDNKGNFITQWYCRTPWGVDVDSVGNIYVASEYSPRINKYDSTGTLITNWGYLGNGDGQTNHPEGVAVDASDYVYIADFYNSRIQKFDSNGNFITKWGSSGVGIGEGQFSALRDVDVDSSGFVYTCDMDSNRIQKFDSNGNFITKWGSYGSGDGQFKSPVGVTVDSNGYVYVADLGNHRIQVFDSNGNFITKWGSEGNGDGQFKEPRKVAIDPSGKIYVADSGNQNVQVFVKEGETSSISMTPTYDNNLRESSSCSVLGTTTYLDVGKSKSRARDVMLFDLSMYDKNETISKAALSLFWYYPAGATRTSDTVVEVYRPGKWNPKYVTWYYHDYRKAWKPVGGAWFDVNGVAQGSAPYASVTFPAGTVPDNQYHEFDVTQLVQEYISGTYENTGFFLKAQTESGNYIAFYSSDWANADQRPKLTVTKSLLV